MYYIDILPVLFMPPSPSIDYISTKEAAKLCNYSADYLSRLVRKGALKGVQSGRVWLVDRKSLQEFVEAQNQQKVARREALSNSRIVEYRAHQNVPKYEEPISKVKRQVQAPSQARISNFGDIKLLIRSSSVGARTGSLVAAIAVVAAGAFIGNTQLMGHLERSSVALVAQTARGAESLTQPLAASVKKRIAYSRNVLRRDTADVAEFTVHSDTMRKSGNFSFGSVAIERDGQTSDIKADSMVASSTRNQGHIGNVSDRTLVMRVASEYVEGIHWMIDTEVAGVYAAPAISTRVSDIVISSILHIGSFAIGSARSGASYILAYSKGGARVAVSETGEAIKPVTSFMLRVKKGLYNIVNPVGTVVEKSPVAAIAAIDSTDTLSSTAPLTPNVLAASTTDGGTALTTELPSVVSAWVIGDTLSYGDIIDYDAATDVYTLSKMAYDPSALGVAIENPPVHLAMGEGAVPILKQGRVLVNVTLENGPIAAGDDIAASSIRGKGMRADKGSVGIIGIAREPFTSASEATTTTVDGQSVSIGTIVMDVAPPGIHKAAEAGGQGCTGGVVLCALASKVNATPLVSLLRYLVAAAIALGGLYLAFRTFMLDAVNGVLSVGRNPRAKSSIQAMVIFNGVIAVLIALAGLGVGLLILFIKI